MTELKEVNLDRIDLSGTNPRTKLDSDGIPELAASIKANKLYQPVLLRKLNGRYECVDGERRFKAFKLLKRNKIPALIESLNDEQVREIQLISFIQRKDIHPLNEAEAMQGLIETGKYSVEKIADKIGKLKTYVAQRLQLIKLIPDIRKEYIEGKLELGHAILCAKMPEKEQQKIFGYIKKQFRKPTVNDLKVHISTSFMINLNMAPFNRKDKLLLADAGSCNDCPKRTGNAEDLFNDYSGKNICTDAGCYKLKVQLHIERLISQHEEAKKELVKVSDTNWNNKKETIGKSDYKVVTKAEGKKVLHAVYMDGPKKGHLVNIVKIEPEKPAEPKPPTFKETADQENEIIKQKRDAELRKALKEEILKKDLTTEIHPQIARAIINQDLGEIIGEYFYFGENVDLDFTKLDTPKLIGTFNLGAIQAAAEPDYNYPIDFIIDLANTFEIDHKAIKTKIWNENQFVTADDIKKRSKNAERIYEEIKENQKVQEVKE